MRKPESAGPRRVIAIQHPLTNADGVVVSEATGTPFSYLRGAGLLFPKPENELETHVTSAVVGPGSKITGQDEDGEQVTFTVTAIENGIASLDGYHPFAGPSPILEVEIQGVRDATEEELRQLKILV